MKKLLAILLAALLCLTCFVACADKEPEKPVDNSEPTAVVYDVEDATAYLKNMYKKYLVETETAADFTLVSQVMKSGIVYKVTWTTDRDDIKITEDAEKKQVKVDLNEKTPVEIKYTLTATVTDPDGKTATLKFELTIPKYVLLTWAQYLAAADDKAVTVEGYVTAICEGSIYVQDTNNKGGYYVYSLATDVEEIGLKKGMLVSVTGTKEFYNSVTHEIKDASVSILDSKVTSLSPVDITTTFKNAGSNTAASLVEKLGMLVTIKGVEITDQNLGSSQMYLNFKLGKTETYVRARSADLDLSDADLKALATEHGKKRGYSADITGVVTMYGKNCYIIPVSKSAIKYGKLIQRTDAEMVDYEIEILKDSISTSITKDSEITLPSTGDTYSKVTITWGELTAPNPDAAKKNGNKLSFVLQKASATASITATLTCGNTTKTHTIDFKINAKAPDLKENTAYLLYVDQGNLENKRYYFTGTTASNGDRFAATSTIAADAIKVYLEIVDQKDGTKGYYLTFTPEGGKKQYMTIMKVGTYVNMQLVEASKKGDPFTWNGEYSTFVMTVDKTDYYIGTYDSYETLSASKLSYASTSFPSHLILASEVNTEITDADRVELIKQNLALEGNLDEIRNDKPIVTVKLPTTQNNATITWVSNNQFAVVNDDEVVFTVQDGKQNVKLTATIKLNDATATKDFYVVMHGKLEYTTVTAPAENTEYKLFFNGKPNPVGDWYLTGATTDKDYRAAATYDATKSGKVYIENTTGGFYVYFKGEGDTKTYIDIYKNGTYYNLRLSEDNKGLFTLNADNVLVKDVEGTLCFLAGTGYSNAEAKTIDKLTNTSIFPVKLAEPKKEDGGSTTPTSPVVFQFGDNITPNSDPSVVDHKDPSTGFSTSNNQFTSGDYTLTITDYKNAYRNGNDEMGNSCIRVGKSGEAGKFTFVVPDNVTSVDFMIAEYKSYGTAIVKINGTQTTISTLSDKGEYTKVTVDTSTNKTVNFESVLTLTDSNAVKTHRCMIDSITWNFASAN